MSALIALLLVLSTLTGCAGETPPVSRSSPPPDTSPAVYQTELQTAGDAILDADGETLISYSYQRPVLSAPGGGDDALAVCAAFNAAFDDGLADISALADEARDTRALLAENGMGFTSFTAELRCTCYQTERLVSVAGTYATYTGGAHPNTVLLSWNYDLSSGSFFDAATLDADPAFHDAVVRALEAQAEQRAKENGLSPGEYFWENYRDTLENWSSYAVTFDGEGMSVGFSPYELACYAAGPQVFQIPYRDFAASLSPQSLALLDMG